MKKLFLVVVLMIGFGIAASPAGADIIIDHRIVNTTLAFGTVTVNGGFSDLDAMYVAHYLSDQLADGLENDPVWGDPRLSGLAATYGTLTNMEFLTSNLTFLGDPVAAVQSDFTDYLDYINSIVGGAAVLSGSSSHIGTFSMQLYGGVLFEDGNGTVVVTGTANILLYELNYTIDIPHGQNGNGYVPIPQPVLLLGTGLVGLAAFRKRRFRS